MSLWIFLGPRDINVKKSQRLVAVKLRGQIRRTSYILAKRATF